MSGPNSIWEYWSISDVTDAAGATGVKRYWKRTGPGVTQAQIETLGFFNRYELRGWKKGDLVAVITDTRHLLYEIIGDNNPDQHIQIQLIPAVYGSDDQTALEVPATPGAAGTPTAGLGTTQAQLDALNAGLAAQTDDQVAAEVPAVPGAAGTPTAGLTDTQAQLDALNGYLAGITDVQVDYTGPAVAGWPTAGAANVRQAFDQLEGYVVNLTSSQVANVAGPVGTPTAGTTNVQDAIDALNLAVAANGPETAFTPTVDGLVVVTPGGTNGHAPAFGLNVPALVANATMATALANAGPTFAGANTDGIIDITAGGTNGHAPTINLDVAALIANAAMSAALANAGPTFSATNSDGRIAITTGGTNGHAPALNLNLAQLVTDILANPAFITGINNIITARFSWDGTKLCFDYNNDGNPGA